MSNNKDINLQQEETVALHTTMEKEVTAEQETTSSETKNIIRGWDNSFITFNMLANQRDETGRFQVENDEIAERLLAIEQKKATLTFETRRKQMEFMLANNFYRKDLFRNELTIDDTEELFEIYDKNDIGESRSFSRLTFINAYSYKITDASLYIKGLDLLVDKDKRKRIERKMLEKQSNVITQSMLAETGIQLEDYEIKAIENGFLIADETLTIEELNNLYTDEILEKLGLTKELLPTARFEEKYILMEDRATRTVVHSLDVNGGAPLGKEDVKTAIELMAKREFLPSTPSYGNAGLTTGAQKISCVIIKVDDNIKSIDSDVGSVLRLSKKGTGIGIVSPNLRALGEKVGELDNRAHGTIKIAKMVQDNVLYADQDGKRQGSAVYNIDAFHADYKSLLDSKKENVDASIRLTNLSIGLIIRDKLMNLFLEGEEGFYSFFPHTVFQEYGIEFSEIDINEMYDELVANPRIRKIYTKFEDFIAELPEVASESGYPYPIFADAMTRANPMKKRIAESNLCTEISQDLTSERAIQCNLASLGWTRAMQGKDLERLARHMTRHLNGVMDNSDFSDVQAVQRGMEERRAIGIGTADLHGVFAQYGIPYESTEAIDFVNVAYAQLNYYTLSESVNLVKEGKYPPIKDFAESTYADGTYFDMYIDKDYVPQTEKVKEMFEGMRMITKADWQQLKEDAMKYGVANAYRIAIAPNGTTSYSMGSTAGITPITQLIESRKTASMGSALYPMPNLNPNNYFLYKNAYHIDDFKYFDLIATMQQHVDQAISTTFFITDDYTTTDWWTRIVYAWYIGLKTVYYTRPKITTSTGDKEMENKNNCESCSG